jgi:FlaG/FlaF family flagellin (archaellin)
MKKVAFVVVLVAVIIGIVFGGISLASAAPAAKPTPRPTPTPTTGGPVYMEVRSGHVIIGGNSTTNTIYSENYPQIRHVSLTMNIYNVVGNSTLQITAEIGGMSPNAVLEDIWFPNGVYTVECDASGLEILAPFIPPSLTVDYNITMTYPQ